MKEQFERILERYGQEISVLTDQETVTTRAFMQPAAQKDKAAPFTMTELGAVDDRLWTYLGSVALKERDRIQWGEEQFTVNSCEPYYVGEELVYWWAALERAKEAAT